MVNSERCRHVEFEVPGCGCCAADLPRVTVIPLLFCLLEPKGASSGSTFVGPVSSGAVALPGVVLSTAWVAPAVSAHLDHSPQPCPPFD